MAATASKGHTPPITTLMGEGATRFLLAILEGNTLAAASRVAAELLRTAALDIGRSMIFVSQDTTEGL